MQQKPRQDPPPSGPQDPSQPPESDPKKDDKALVRNREGVIFAILFAASLLASTYPLPWSMLSVLFALLGLAWAIRYFIAGARTQKPGSWIVLGAVGTLGCLLMLVTAAVNAAMWPVQSEYEKCVASAITEQAALGCVSEREDGLAAWFESTTGQPYPYANDDATESASATEAPSGSASTSGSPSAESSASDEPSTQTTTAATTSAEDSATA